MKTKKCEAKRLQLQSALCAHVFDPLIAGIQRFHLHVEDQQSNQHDSATLTTSSTTSSSSSATTPPSSSTTPTPNNNCNSAFVTGIRHFRATSFVLAIGALTTFLAAMRHHDATKNNAAVIYNTMKDNKSSISAVAYFYRGLAHERLEKFDKAVADFTRALTNMQTREATLKIKDLSNSSSSSSSSSSSDTFNSSMELTDSEVLANNMNDVDVTVTAFDEDLGTDVTDDTNHADTISAFTKLVTITSEDIESEDDLQRYECATETKKNHLSEKIIRLPIDLIYNNRGYLYVKQKKYKLALVDFTHALGMNPMCFSALKNRALVFYKLQMFEQTVSDITSLFGLFPESLETHASLLLTRAISFYKLSRIPEALQDFQQAQAQQPSKSDAVEYADDDDDSDELMHVGPTSSNLSSASTPTQWSTPPSMAFAPVDHETFSNGCNSSHSKSKDENMM